MQRLFDLAEAQVHRKPDLTFLASKINGSWVTLSRAETWKQAQDLASGLLSLGAIVQSDDMEKQTKIALISNNRPEWLITDLAVQQTGAIITPLYPTISADEFAFVMNEAEVKILFVANQELYNRFSIAFDKVSSLQHIFSFDEINGVKNWKTLKPTEEGNQQREAVRKHLTAQHVATIIYTSGTTGKPKGVVLSHKNIVSNVLASKPCFDFAKEGERALSFLPLNHIFEKMVTYIYVDNGISIYYAESMETIGDNLKEVKPMVFTCVPRLLEKVYEKIMTKGAELTGIKKALFFWAVEQARNYDTVNKGSAWFRFKLSIANKLIFKKWREALGGNVVAIVSGAAPLADKLNRIFSGAQLPVMEGYGLTETSPVISVNLLSETNRRIGTVGPLIQGVEVKIADDGEILCKGDNVMIGYYKNPEMTAEVMDKEGWFHTGDIGMFVENKFLKITDRKKEIFKTSGGKYVAPQVVEGKMRESRFIEQIMVVGPNRKFVAALIVPSFINVRHKFKEDGIELPESNEALIKNEQVIALIQEQVDKQNEHLSHVEQVKKFVLLPEEWTVENGILTPKLSLRRKKVDERYQQEIESLYV